MHQLQESEYERLRPLFAGLRYNLVVDSIIDGNTPAWVFVDDAASPRSALMWNRQDALLIAGDAENKVFNAAVGQVMVESVIPDARERYIPELSLHYDRDAWCHEFDLILPDLHIETAGRRYYTLGQLKVDWRTALPQGVALRPIDEALLYNAELKNGQHVVGWVRSFWRSYADFVETSFGYAMLVDGDTIASWCLAVYVSGDNFELGLATMPDFRRRGFATLVASACVDHCLTHGLIPHWHCWDDNVASIATAAKVGFDNPTSYTVVRFEL